MWLCVTCVMYDVLICVVAERVIGACKQAMISMSHTTYVERLNELNAHATMI